VCQAVVFQKIFCPADPDKTILGSFEITVSFVAGDIEGTTAVIVQRNRLD